MGAAVTPPFRKGSQLTFPLFLKTGIKGDLQWPSVFCEGYGACDSFLAALVTQFAGQFI